MEKYAIIVAGGSGKRMESNIPKQFLKIGKKLVLMHSIDAFRSFDENINIVLVLPESQMEYWKEKCRKFRYSCDFPVAMGGDTRFHSVKNGLEYVAANSLVAVHDGVRPLVSEQTIATSFKLAKENGAAVPCLSMADSVRLINDEGSRTFDRHLIKRVQTPQTFLSNALKRAYKQEYLPSFTDDASVVESIGQQITLFDGNRENLKITRPFDLLVADCYLRKKSLGEL